MKYTHLVFDMDGTLVNTALYTVPAIQQAARELNLPVPDEEMAVEVIGYGTRDFFDALVPGQPGDVRTAYEGRMRALERQGAVAIGGSIAFPGAVEALRQLKEGGARLYLISAAQEEYMRLILGTIGALELFDGLQHGAGAKEERTIRLKATAPDAAWAFIGDRFKDSDAAKAAGMPSFYAGWGFSPKTEAKLFTHAPESFAQLLELLGY